MLASRECSRSRNASEDNGTSVLLHKNLYLILVLVPLSVKSDGSGIIADLGQSLSSPITNVA